MNTREKYTIAGLGEVLWDIYGKEKFLGGAPANFAAHAQQLGQTGIILSRVGKDELGEQLREQLEEMQIDSASIQIDPTYSTGTVIVTLDQAGIPSFECTKDVAFDHLEFDRKWQTIALRIDAVLFGTLAQRNEDSRQTILEFLSAASQALKIFDINLRGWNKRTREIVETSLQKADVIKLNDDELATLRNMFGNDKTGDFVPSLIEKYHLRLVTVTLREKGAVIWTPKDRHYSPGFHVQAVDTTGSGDAFAAALVVKMLEGASVPEMADYANLLGAFVATQKGAVPKWDESALENIKRISERVYSDDGI